MKKLILNPDLNKHSIWIRVTTKEEVKELLYDNKNLSTSEFYTKWKIHKTTILFTAGSPEGVNLGSTNVGDIIPSCKVRGMTSYTCYVGHDHTKLCCGGDIMHETSNSSFLCALEKLGKPKYVLVYKEKL